MNIQDKDISTTGFIFLLLWSQRIKNGNWNKSKTFWIKYNLAGKIKTFIGNKKNIDVTISIKEFDPDYVGSLNRSITQAESNDVISFTMEEFVA